MGQFFFQHAKDALYIPPVGGFEVGGDFKHYPLNKALVPAVSETAIPIWTSIAAGLAITRFKSSVLSFEMNNNARAVLRSTSRAVSLNVPGWSGLVMLGRPMDGTALKITDRQAGIMQLLL
jgi:hypothetical protein